MTSNPQDTIRSQPESFRAAFACAACNAAEDRTELAVSSINVKIMPAAAVMRAVEDMSRTRIRASER